MCGFFSSALTVQGPCAVNVWMMICQGARTRFLVYYDEWATLAPHTHHVLYIEAVTLALHSTTLPSPTVTPAGVTVLDSLGVPDSSVSAHGHTCATLTSPVVVHNRRGIYTAEFLC